MASKIALKNFHNQKAEVLKRIVEILPQLISKREIQHSLLFM